jgi:prepilin-type N-terminal cleavage/methylation domain-containing protein
MRMNNARRARHRRGFSAVELLVTMAILAVLLVAALPSFQERLATSRARGAAQEVADRIQAARRLAVTEGVPYLVIWEDPRTLFVVEDRDRNLAADAGESRDGPIRLAEGIHLRIHPGDPFSDEVIAVLPSGNAHEAGSLEIQWGGGPPVRLTVSATGARCVVTPG